MPGQEKAEIPVPGGVGVQPGKSYLCAPRGTGNVQAMVHGNGPRENPFRNKGSTHWRGAEQVPTELQQASQSWEDRRQHHFLVKIIQNPIGDQSQYSNVYGGQMGRTSLFGSIYCLLLSRHLCKPEVSTKCVIIHHEGPCAILRFANIQTCSVVLSLRLTSHDVWNHRNRGKWMKAHICTLAPMGFLVNL